MHSARNVLLADRFRCPSSSPIGVYGPTMKISSRPMTRGGSSRLHSTPASQTRGNGSRPRAISHASGVQITNSTPSVTAPDSTETTSGSSAPGAVSELTTACQDRWVSRASTGPSRAIQITAAAMTETAPDTERTLRGVLPGLPGGPGGTEGPDGPGACSPGTVPLAAVAALAAQLTLDGAGYRAGVAEHRGRQHREAAGLVLREARAGQRVRDERGPGRGRRADRGDVDDLRGALIGLAAL